MNTKYVSLLYLFFLTILSCNTNMELDKNKLDKDYFLGDYVLNFNKETEQIILKENGYYNYIKTQDTQIIDAGKWIYKYDSNECFVTVFNYPKRRKYSLYTSNDTSKFYNMSLNINTNIKENFGNLEMYIVNDDDEFYLSFEKVDKSKNKNYIKK